MRRTASALLLVLVSMARAHQLDEYLQATTISLGRSRVWAFLRLTPGVKVYRQVIARIDVNGDGGVSSAEQRAYAARVLRDLTLSVDRHRLKVRLVALRFPTVEAMRKGLGDIELSLDATLPAGASRRSLVFENRHRPDVSAYLVNCLAPSDPGFRVTAQRRDVRQSRYELDYVQSGPRFSLSSR